MFVLIVGSGRVGSAVARRMLSEGHEVSVLDEDPEAIAQLEKGEDRGWEDMGGAFTVGTALEIDADQMQAIDQDLNRELLACTAIAAGQQRRLPPVFRQQVDRCDGERLASLGNWRNAD